MAIGKKIQACFREMFLCCTGWNDAEQHQQERPLVISNPTDFRREEINIPGLTQSQYAITISPDPAQQQADSVGFRERHIREKATNDAQRMWANLSPLRSSPSGNFAERPPPGPPPTYEEFTQPRSPPSTPTQKHSSFPARPVQEVSPGRTGRMDRVRAHGRKISGGFRPRPTTISQPGGEALELGNLCKKSEDSRFDDEESDAVGLGLGAGDRKDRGLL